MNNIARSFRRWLQTQAQPHYAQVPGTDTDHDEVEPKTLDGDLDTELGRSGSSSISGSSVSGSFVSGPGSRRNSDYLLSPTSPTHPEHLSGLSMHWAEARHILSLLAILAMRLPYLVFLVVTAPVRRLFARSAALARATHGAGSGTGRGWPAVYDALEEYQVLVPSFLRPDDGKPVRAMHPTAWLDGLRGVAAFLVMLHHASLLWFGWHIHYGYGTAESDNNGPGGERYLVQWPIVRLVVSGVPHVAVFFVVSGYALSYKPLKLARQGRLADASEAVNSSIFRRHTRLFLMPAVTTFLIAMGGYLELFPTSGWGGVAVSSRRPPHAKDGTLFGNVWLWACDFLKMVNPIDKSLSRGNVFAYDYNLWTLPVEFDCSLMLFLCLAAFTRLQARMRMALMLFVSGICLWRINWQPFLFFAGMLVCEINMAFVGRKTALAPSLGRARLQKYAGIASFVVCLFVLSMPEDKQGGAKTPGYRTLHEWAPALNKQHKKVEHFYIPLAAVALVATVDRTPCLQRLFTTRLAQYFGKISYSMYLVHGAIIWSVGHWSIRHAVALTGAADEFQYAAAVALASVATFPVIIVLADLATRTVDERAVRFGRALYDWMCVREDKPVLPRTQ